MFKKLGTLALTAAVTLLGFQAPANAAASDPVAGSVINTYVTFNMTMNTVVPVGAGITGLSLSKSWTPNAADIASLGGKTLAFRETVTQPDGTSVVVSSGPGSSSSGVMASSSSNIGVYGNGKPSLNTMFPASTLTLPADLTGYNSGNLSDSIYVSNRSSNSALALPTGNWTISISVTVDGTAVTETNTMGGSWAANTNMNSLTESTNALSAVAPTGVSGVSVSAYICTATNLLHTGDVLTGSALINGVPGASPYSSFSPRVQNPSGRGSQSGTVVAADLTYGVYAQVSSRVNNPTAGTTYAASFTMLNQNSDNITSSCAPAAPAKPTLAFTNGSFVGTFTPGAGSDNYSNTCYLYDATDLNTVVATASNIYIMSGSSGTCSFSSGTTVGHSYVVKASGGWNGYVTSDLSPASDAVVKPAVGYTFTSPVSGITNAGGKLSRVSNSIAMDTNASAVTATNDGGSGSIVIETEQSTSGGSASSTAFVLRHVTKTGTDSTFGGTGSITVTPASGGYAGGARLGWYGANHTNWALTYGGYEPNAMGSGVNIVTGTFGSSTTSTVNVATSVLNAACVSAYGAGLVSTTPSMGPSVPNLQVVSAVTANPVFLLPCYKPTTFNGMTSYLSNPVLITVSNSTTVNVVKALYTPSASLNNATVSFSSNPSAAAGAAAATFVVQENNTTASGTTTASRIIINMKSDLTFTNSAGTYTPSGAEPTVRLSGLNDGTVWGLLTSGQNVQLLKISGDTVTTTALAPDTVAGFTSSVFTMPLGVQAGSATSIALVRNSNPVGSIAMATVDTATGAVTTAEVGSYTVAQANNVLSAYFFASNNVYWMVSEIATPTAYSLYKWLDPNFHLTSQTLSWGNNTPTSVTVGSTATVAATATSTLAVTYGTTDAAVCTVTQAGVVTPVAYSGNCVVTADQVGNGSFDSAPQITTTLAIQKGAQTITWTLSPNKVVVGSTATVAATTTSHLTISYGTSDAAVCTVTQAGVVTPVATTGNCVVTADQAGNNAFNAAAQKTLTLAINAAAPVKLAPKGPAVAAKLKVGKTITVALSATKGSAAKGANVDGLATVVSVAPSSKAFCSATKVVKAGKITGYTVKGLKVGKCSIVVTITGNDIYNALTKTVVATVTK